VSEHDAWVALIAIGVWEFIWGCRRATVRLARLQPKGPSDAEE